MTKFSLLKSKATKKEFENYLKKESKKRFSKTKHPSHKHLQSSLCYTLLAPSSFFRSLLAMEVTRYLGVNKTKIFPWALSIEMIHSGSLIHDDLPSMDDGKLRRNKKCNHLIYGEDISLLSGSTLFIESFSLLEKPVFKGKSLQMLNLLISKVGFQGLMAGQTLDLRDKNSSLSSHLKMIELKTGALIEASVEGPLLLWCKKEKEKMALKKFAKNLGIAYQLADDLQDKDYFKDKKTTKDLLSQFTKKGLQNLCQLKDQDTSPLKDFLVSNEKRAYK